MAKSKAQTEQEALLAAADEGGEELIDLSGVEAVRYSALDPGKYLAEVVSCTRDKVKQGDNKGAPKLVIRYNVIEDEEGNPLKKPLFDHRLLTGKSAGMTRARLDDLGVDTSVPIDVDDIVGRKVWLVVSIRKDRPSDNNIDSSEPFEAEASEDVDALK